MTLAMQVQRKHRNLLQQTFVSVESPVFLLRSLNSRYYAPVVSFFIYLSPNIVGMFFSTS